MNRDRLQHILGVAKCRKLLVIGDVMLDEFVWGRVSRISPEAPVPVVEVIEESSFPGGAANVARNLVAFSGGVEVLGLVGCDREADRLRELLGRGSIGTDGLVTAGGFTTIVKTRIIARQQQVVRVDRERRLDPEPDLEQRLGKRIEELIGNMDGIIIEDYGKGLVTPTFKTTICRMAAARELPVFVDPNPGNPLDWSGVTVVKPNRSEAFAAAGMPPKEPCDDPLADAPLIEVGRHLSKTWKTGQLLITLGEHGMMLFQPEADPYHTPTRAREVFDVSGAGDTVIAFFALAMVSGASPREAAEIANAAAGIVVGKLGTATAEPDELIKAFQ